MSNSSPIRGDTNSTIRTVRLVVDHPHLKIRNLELDSRYATSGPGLALAIRDGERRVLDTLNVSPNPTNDVLEHQMITSEPFYNQGNSTLCVVVTPNKDYESRIQKRLDETTSSPAPARLTHATIHSSVDTAVELIRTRYQSVELEMSGVKDGVVGANDIVSRTSETYLAIQLRVLLDLSRDKLAEHVGFRSWKALVKSYQHSGRSGVNTLERFVSEKYQARGISPPSSVILTTLCGTSNTHIRERGNAAAHTATRADIRRAIVHFSKDQSIMEEIYFFIFGKSIHEDDSDDIMTSSR